MTRNGWFSLAWFVGLGLTTAAAACASPAPPTVLCVTDSLTPAKLPARERVRITPARSGDIRTGRLAWISPDTLALDDGGSRYPLTSIRMLERSTNRHSKGGSGAKLGALVGGVAVGLTAGAVAATDDPEFAAITVPACVLAGALGGILIGGVVGATIHTETWVPVAVQTSPLAAMGNRVRVRDGRIPGEEVTGTILERTTDTLYVMRDDARVAVPLSPPPSMEVSLGVAPPSSTPGKVLAALGLIGGAIAGGYILGHGHANWSYGPAIVTGAAIGATGGWFLGRTLSRVGSEEQWRVVSLP